MIVRTSDGAAVSLDHVPGVDIAEWDGDDTIDLAFDLRPCVDGGYQYQWQKRICIPELPAPWRLPEIEGAHPLQPPALTPVLHQGRDYSHVLPVLPECVGSAPAGLVLAAPVPGGLITRGAFGPDEAAVGDALAVVPSGDGRPFLLVAISPETARLRPLLSFDLPEPAWPHLWLTIRPAAPGSRDRAPSFPVPVIQSTAAFECAAPDVAAVAFWVGWRG